MWRNLRGSAFSKLVAQKGHETTVSRAERNVTARRDGSSKTGSAADRCDAWRERQSDDPDHLPAVSERLLFCSTWQIAFIIRNLDTRNSSSSGSRNGRFYIPIQRMNPGGSRSRRLKQTIEADDCVSGIKRRGGRDLVSVLVILCVCVLLRLLILLTLWI